MAVLAFGFASCADDKSDLGIEQTNPQEAIMSADGVTIAFGEAVAAKNINLANYQTTPVPVLQIQSAENLPENAEVYFQMQVSADKEYTNPILLDVVDGCVSGVEWENAYRTIIGNAPEAKTNYIRFIGYVKDGSQISRLGGEDFYYGSTEVTVTPIDLKICETQYFLNGRFLNDIEMSHSDKHPYDDPVFYYLFTVTPEQAQQGFTWSVIPASLRGGSEFYGPSETGDVSDMSGSLVLGTTYGVINEPGNYKMEINAVDMTYKIALNIEYLYTPGPANGWSFDNNMLLFTEDYVHYHGYVYVENEFKLTGGASWDLNWGTGATAGSLGMGGQNIKVDQNGLYYVTADIVNLTYTCTLIQNIGIIGGLNNWGSQINLTPSADFKTWTGVAEFTDNLEWKFRANDNWDINLGGSLDNLVPGGDNLLAPSTGKFTVTLELGKLPYKATMAK